MKIKDFMTTKLITVDPQETVAAGARLLGRNGLGALPVVGEGGRLRGVLTHRDITQRCVAAGLDPNRTRVGAVMTTHAFAAGPEDSAALTAKAMADRGLRRLPVTQSGRLVGMVSLSDLSRQGDLG